MHKQCRAGSTGIESVVHAHVFFGRRWVDTPVKPTEECRSEDTQFHLSEIDTNALPRSGGEGRECLQAGISSLLVEPAIWVPGLGVGECGGIAVDGVVLGSDDGLFILVMSPVDEAGGRWRQYSLL